MRDVARRAEVSVATVSRALRHAPEVPAETRELVQRTAAELGYRMHPFVSTLMRARRQGGALTRTPPLAFVTAFPTAAAWQRQPTPLLPLMFRGAQERAAQRGYSLTHYWLHQDGMSQARFSGMLRARGVRGILLPPPPEYGFAVELAWEHFSTVILGVTPLAKHLHCVSNDHFQSMQLAIEMCRQRGYRRPGLAVDATTNLRLDRRWEAAFRIALEQFTGEPVRPLFLQEWSAAELRRWALRERVDALVSVFTPGQLAALRAEGLAVPARVGLVSLSVHDDAGPLAGIQQHAELLGACGVDQLIASIERNEHGVPEHPLTLSVRGSWVEGETLPPRLSS